MTTDDVRRKAGALLRLHRDPELLTLVNAWDVASARAVAETPGTRAVATASHAVAASFGHEDGEQIPREVMLDMVGRIAAAVDLPVTADLEGGYGDAADTVRRAIGLGVVGANIEDELKPVAEAAAQVEAVVRAAAQEGVDFVLNARTDVFLAAGDRDPRAVLAEAIERGRAFLDAGAPVVFAPALLDEDGIAELAGALGPQRLSLMALPGLPSLARLQELGVARLSYGPMPQRFALEALQQMVRRVHGGEAVPTRG